jgi:hypothetical protein
MTYQCSVPTSGMHKNCTTYKNTQTGTNARIATSQQYPNSSSSFPPSASLRLYSPRRRPGSKELPPGPSKRPTRKKKSVAVMSERSRKWPNINTSVICRVCVKPSAYAKPQARDVRVRKKQRRYVKDGSGRWYVFVVCFCVIVNHNAKHNKKVGGVTW